MKRQKIQDDDDDDPLNRAIEMIRSVKDELRAPEHQHVLDRALTLLTHTGIAAEEHEEKVDAVLKKLQDLFNKNWDDIDSRCETLDKKEFAAELIRIGKELNMCDVVDCIWSVQAIIRSLAIGEAIPEKDIALMNGALDRLNFYVVHRYHREPLMFPYMI